MRINGHAHVFTLQSVLSREAIAIMGGRLRRMGVPAFVVEAVEELLDQQLDRPEYLVEDELLVRFMRAMASRPSFKDLRRRTPDLPVEIRVLGGRTGRRLEVRALRAALDRLSSWIDARHGPGRSPFDVFETLRVAMQPDIPRVADKLLSHLGPDDAIVALMMDIVAADEPERDRRNFEGQIRGTMDAAVAHPGRVLPFFAVNPRRPDHFELMRRAVEAQGFVGVKLYPSLGYRVTTRAMEKVLGYCRDEDLPVVVHCTAGGFHRDAESAGYSHPKHWLEVFAKPRDSLRVCFAHCGGWGGFSGQVEDHVEWAGRILSYMDDHPNVYADLSYHVEMMIRGGEVERTYFRALKGLLEGPRAERIIFGTDSWLLRLNVDDAAYWRYFEAKCTKAEFETIAGTAPRRFLGLPVDGEPPRPNIRRHLEFLERHAEAAGGPPAAWVRELSGASWPVARSDPAWSANNHAHVTAFNHFRGQIPRRLRGDGFPDAGRLRLRQLDYFAASGRGPSRTKLRGNARNLMALSLAYGGVPEDGWSENAVHERLVDLLGDGSRTLADVGATLDGLYRFSREVA
jgi:predicted TIM-barrel fold metal-dependent hydrolase